MNIITINRDDVGLIARAPLPVSVLNNLSNMTGNEQYTSKYFQDYLDTTKAYLASDAYLKKAMSAGNFNDGSFMYIGIYIVNLSNYLTVNSTMQEYILASPFVQKKVRNKEMLGYIGVNFNQDLQDQVLSNFIIEDGDELYRSTFFTSDDELTLENQHDILDTWDNIRNIWSSGIDPTDLRNLK